MCQRKAQKVERFVGNLVQIVSYGQVCSVSLCDLRFHIGWALDWLRGGRYAVGSGIVVSSIVSHPVLYSTSSSAFRITSA